MPRFTMTHHSRPIVLLAALALTALTATRGAAQRLPLPDGARTHWVVKEPQEIVGYLVFDPATVAERLPSTLRFISVGELARGGVSWAAQYLAGAPSRDAWGVSFVEIVRADTFTINGRAPRWPSHGAAALWFARVAPADSTEDLGPGVPWLVLDLWVPDSSYAAEMRRLGHYASYGNVKLLEDAHGAWHGSLLAEGLRVAAACTPSGAESGGPASRGMQALFPPARSGVSGVVRISFVGHRERTCAEPESWTLGGTHPLALAEQVGSSSFEFGYELVGGAYPGSCRRGRVQTSPSACAAPKRVAPGCGLAAPNGAW